jgi:integration host factor subunit beta
MISKKDCARVVDAFLDAIKEALHAQQNIEVRGFGTFKIRHRKTRMARNPRTGSPVEVSARPVPVFKPSKELRAMVADLLPLDGAEPGSWDDDHEEQEMRQA